MLPTDRAQAGRRRPRAGRCSAPTGTARVHGVSQHRPWLLAAGACRGRRLPRRCGGRCSGASRRCVGVDVHDERDVREQLLARTRRRDGLGVGQQVAEGQADELRRAAGAGGAEQQREAPRAGARPTSGALGHLEGPVRRRTSGSYAAALAAAAGPGGTSSTGHLALRAPRQPVSQSRPHCSSP